jgi:3D (Asp-Asp-Asp) domain-containing protein
LEEREKIDMVLVGFILLLVLMLVGFGVLFLWISRLKTELLGYQRDSEETNKGVQERIADLNEDVLKMQTAIPEFEAELSEYRTILRTTNAALTRLRRKQENSTKTPRNENEESTTESSSRKDETMHEVFSDSEQQVIAEAESYDSGTDGMTYMGVWEISAYEYTGNPTASGTMPTEWRTCAFNSAPLGATIYITGLGYFLNEDVCGTPSRLDIYLGDVASCEAFGIQNHEVYIVN